MTKDYVLPNCPNIQGGRKGGKEEKRKNAVLLIIGIPSSFLISCINFVNIFQLYLQLIVIEVTSSNESIFLMMKIIFNNIFLIHKTIFNAKQSK